MQIFSYSSKHFLHISSDFTEVAYKPNQWQLNTNTMKNLYIIYIGSENYIPVRC